jgi:FtsP/CotA-like multicopper oxidase with cupredoxin domain
MKKRTGITRREFAKRTMAFTAGAALASAFPSFAQSSNCTRETLNKIGEIVGRNGKLKGVLKVRSGVKTLPGYTGQPPMMRYFEGYDQQVPLSVWPPRKDGCLPGPTLRVGVGERVELTFLNQVNVAQFQGSIDRAETGDSSGCDEVRHDSGSEMVKWYPEVRGDTYPNCFHGSSTGNLHFHGTHVTPDAFGDNVLVQIRPDPLVTEDKVKAIFEEVFAHCAKSHAAPKWKDLPASFREAQEAAVKSYDLNATWKGKRGPVTNEAGEKVPALPPEHQLTPANQQAIEEGRWPPFFVGAYPSCFKVTESAGHAMGQAPGTHWYHSHKHGSTAINLYNGLAGALIITGKYDAQLAERYPRLKGPDRCAEKVLISQVFEANPDLVLQALGKDAGGAKVVTGTKATMTNGTQVIAASAATQTPQVAPTIVMRPGEVQLWRIINAQVQATINGAFTGPCGEALTPATLPRFRQIAQDGVQFDFYNYQTQPLTTPGPDPDNANEQNGTTFALSPGGRIDILVKVPASFAPGSTFELANLANLEISGKPVSPAESFPDPSTGAEKGYLEFPLFLKDIGSCRIRREITFGWETHRINAGPATVKNASNIPKPTHNVPIGSDVAIAPGGEKTIRINEDRAPYFTIDGQQFEDHEYSQTMILGDNEEWTIYNTTNAPHPFHIHVNPFQVVEVFDPNTPANSYTKEQHGVWQDVVSIPAAKKYVAPTTAADIPATAEACGIPAAAQTATNLLCVDPDTGVPRDKDRGYVRIRSRFVDFPGSYVLHCHILAHEDRGMMQLVRVVDGGTTIRHH